MKGKITLGKFDRKYYKSLPGYDETMFSNDRFFHTIFYNGERAGVVGYTPAKSRKGLGFIEVVIDPKFRRKGLVGPVEDLLVKQHNLDKLFAVIKKTNIASIGAHRKAGFKDVSPKFKKIKGKIMLVKNYKNKNKVTEQFIEQLIGDKIESLLISKVI